MGRIADIPNRECGPLTTVVAAYALGDSDITAAFSRGLDKTRLALAEQEAGALAYQAYVNAGLQNQVDSINVRTTPITQIHQGGDKVLDQVASVTLTGSGASTQATITLTDAQTFSGVYKPISLNQQPDVTYQNPAVTQDCASTTDHAAYETPDLIVFGVNGTSDQAKQQTAQYAQAAITKLKAQYGITDGTVGINGSKIAICAEKNGPMGGIANNRGINVFSLDSDNIDPQYTKNNNAGYKQLLHHELTHVLQSILVNNSQENNLLERWFAEGQATFSSNQLIKWDSISVQQWQASRMNPISMTASNSDPSTQDDAIYYPMYGLAIHYLLDSTTHGGAGNKLSDLLNLLRDVGTSSGGYQGAGQDVSYFETAFANRIKIGGQPLTVADFQANFYTYILTYLRGLETAGTVTGAQNVSGVALFAQNADIAQDETVSEGGASNGSFTLNVSNVPDGQYVLVFAQSGMNNSSVLRKCPTLVTVTNGRLTTTSFMIDTSWSSTNRTN